MSNRLVLTFATGDAKYTRMAKALAISLDLHGSTASRAIVTDSQDPELRELYAVVLAPDSRYSHWFTKLCALECTNADQVLFIDADCLVVRNPDFVFDMAAGSDFAVSGSWVTETEWYGDMTAVMKRRGLKQIPKFSGGLLYYERTDRTQQLIDRIMALAADYDSIGLARNHGQIVDEVCISIAMAESSIGKVLQDGPDISMTPWGRIGPIHLDVLRGECSFVKDVAHPRVRTPAIYHSAHAGIDVDYWREVERVLDIRRRSRTLVPGVGEINQHSKWRRAAVEWMRRFGGPR